MEVSDVQVAGGGAGRWFGLGGEVTLAVTVRNTGSVQAAVPPLRYGFGVGEVSPNETFSSGAIVPAGQERTIAIPVEVPAGFGGAFRAVAHAADEAAPVSSARWSTRPWALLGLFVALVLLAGLAVRAPVRRALTPRVDAEDPSTDSTETSAPAYPLPDVVFVEQIGGVLINPSVLRRSRLLTMVGGRIALEDLMRLGSDGAPANSAGESAPLPTARNVLKLHWQREDKLEPDPI